MKTDVVCIIQGLKAAVTESRIQNKFKSYFPVFKNNSLIYNANKHKTSRQTMQISHVISDTILALTGFFVFFRYLQKLDFFETLLWESFVLSVTAAATIGALGFAGVQNIAWIGVFFQNMAAIVGALGLLAASWYLVKKQEPDKNTTIGILAFGFILLGLKLVLNISPISTVTSLGSMLFIALISIYGILKGDRKTSFFLLLGVTFAALANSRGKFIADPNISIDVYHYLLAISILCFGFAAYHKNKITY